MHQNLTARHLATARVLATKALPPGLFAGNVCPQTKLVLEHHSTAQKLEFFVVVQAKRRVIVALEARAVRCALAGGKDAWRVAALLLFVVFRQLVKHAHVVVRGVIVLVCDHDQLVLRQGHLLGAYDF